MKLSEWLFTSLLVPIIILFVQKRFNKKKEQAEITNLILDAKIKLNELTEKKMQELEQEAEELKKQNRDMANRYKNNLDDCLKQMQDMQELHSADSKRHSEEIRRLRKQLARKLKR